MTGRLRGLAIVAAIAVGACSSGSGSGSSSTKTTQADNQVFFTGYVYDGATGMRLTKTMINSVSILYGEKTIDFEIVDDGRFASKDPLPTWQDYTVKIDATGYRAFASYNTGIDVPASIAMTNGAAQAATVQTLDFAASVFPVALKAPKLTLTITVLDPQTTAPITDKVNGQLRLRPQSSSTLLIGGSTSTSAAKRVWSNGEDLLTQTINMPFMNGSAVIDEGVMVYGVAYELNIYGVDGYQPLDFTGAIINNFGSGTPANPPIIAGTVTTETFQLVPDAQNALKINTIDAATCVPPSPTSNDYGGKVTLTFNYDIEVVGSTLAEDIDNGISITVPQSTSGSSINGYCALRPPTGDPAQERGSKVEIGTNTMTFSFNPTVGISTMSMYGGTCTLPPSITSILYYSGNLLINVQPKGQPLLKRPLSTMLSEKVGTSQIACPLRTNF
jgi:hypothetical protein